MHLSREAGNEQGYHLVADELVDDPVPLVDHACGGAVEARDELGEVVRRHPLCERRRASHVGEQKRELDLRSPGFLSTARKHARGRADG
jgi:hypothetical protein